jgi:cell division protein FtsW
VARKLKFDRGLFIATLLLVCTSIVMVYSASAVMSLAEGGDGSQVVVKQGMWAVLGVAMLAIVMRIDYRFYRNDTLSWMLIAGVGALLVLVLLGAEARGGARRWLGWGGLGIQPSEFAKVASILFAAVILERRMHRIDDMGYSLLPIAIVVGTLAGLTLGQPDFGTAMMLLLIVGVMVLVAGLSARNVLAGAAALLPVVVLIALLAPYRVRRLTSFWDPWADPRGDGYNAIQSMLAVATGGIFGRGLTEGRQKITFLPEPESDFIFSVISEELGLLGATGLLLCFCFIAWRALRIALRAQDRFAALLATGITTMICAQAFVNMSVALSLLPTKGIPLPLVSAGGSSLLVSLLGIGVLLNISQHEAIET